MTTKILYPQSLEKLPKNFINHFQWADYIELLCIANIDGEYSQSDFLSRVQNRADDLYEIEEEEDDQELPSLEKDDKWNSRAVDYFAHLEFRLREFGEFYPFEFSSSTSIKLKESLNEKHKFYLFFLYAANLRYCIEHKADLTGNFELISRDALRQMLPENAEVHVFGKGPGIDSPYQGTKWEKIKSLAADLRAVLNVTENYFNANDTGDRGLDIVGYVPCPDNASGMLSVFGQCACSPDQWVNKQHSSSWDSWSAVLQMCPPPTNTAFIPLCFRDISGDWDNKLSIHNTLLVDRLRFIRLMSQHFMTFCGYSSYSVINDLIQLKENLN